jgi:poly(A) polymerase
MFDDLKELLEILQPARIVGGAVRNAILAIPLHDIDIATEILPETAMKIARHHGFNVIPTGIKHGTITCVKTNSYEVTTLRVDKITDGRHAIVEFSKSWKGDAERRDFTMNALYSDFYGNIIDFVGGLNDLEKRFIRFIGTAEERIREDYLRILRFFRFYAWYCDDYNAQSLKACLALAPNLAKISRERCTYEFTKLLQSSDPAKSVKLMSPEIFTYAGLPALLQNTISLLQTKGLSLIGKLSLFAPQHQLILSRKSERLLKQLHDLEDMLDLKDYVKWINTCDHEILWDGIRIKGRKQYDDLAIWIQNLFPLQGRDLLSLGYSPGPEISIALNKAREAFYSYPRPLSKDDLLKIIVSSDKVIHE